MIAYHTAMVMVINITRVLVHKMLYLIIMVKHQHERDDSELTAGTCSQVFLAAMGIRLNSRNELLHITFLGQQALYKAVKR